MAYSANEIIWLFYIYSFIGWCAEVCVATLRRKKFINRGFVNSPLCPIYGFAGMAIMIFLPELVNNPFFLFLGGFLICSVLEYSVGMLLEKIFHQKLWDYSDKRFSLGGYICLQYSLLWGVLTVIAMLFVNPFLCMLLSKIPHTISVVILWGLSILLIIDFITTSMTVLGMQVKAKQLAQISENLKSTSVLLENALTRGVQKRMQKSFPAINIDELANHKKLAAQANVQSDTFAAGCSFYKLVMLFFVGAFLGDITETIFCLVTTGVLMSRSSVVYGPFSIVWGIGCSLLTLLLYRYTDKSDRYLFLAGTLLGGAYEYVCSVFTELVFGTVFWDYSEFTFNLGGRINLLYCFFWGIAAVVWFKLIYPHMSAWIEKIPKRPGTVICNFMIVFMIINMILSSLALARYTQRNTEPEVVTASEVAQSVNRFLDEHFPDERMERIYPNAKIVTD